MNHFIRNKLADELNDAYHCKQSAAGDLYLVRQENDLDRTNEFEIHYAMTRRDVNDCQIACSDFKAKSIASGCPLAFDQPDFSKLIAMAEEARDMAGEDEGCRFDFDVLAEEVLTIVFGEDFFDWYNEQSE